LKVKIRRWLKDYKDRKKWEGWWRPLFKLLPGLFYYRLSNIYWAIRHRTINVYHKVDTGLKPGYYDVDTLILHSCFNLLKTFVEKDYKGIDDIKERIKFLEKSAVEDKDIPDHYDYSREISNLQEAITLYWWWVNVYPKYEENNPWSKHFNEEYKNGNGRKYPREFIPCTFDEDGDPTLFEWVDNRPEDVKVKEREVLESSMDYEMQCIEETDENLMRLLKIRRNLWT